VVDTFVELEIEVFVGSALEGEDSGVDGEEELGDGSEDADIIQLH